MSSQIPQYLIQEYDILTYRPYEKNQVVVEYTPTKKTLSPEIREYVDDEWERQKAKTPGLFDGPLYNLDELHIDGESVRLELSDTSYKEYVGTRSDHFRNLSGVSHAVNPLSVGMVLTTSDGQIVIGVRGGDVDSYHGMYTTIAGYMERGTDVEAGVPDPFAAAIRELSEESGILQEDVEETTLLGFTGSRQTLAAFHVRLNTTTSQFKKRVPTEIEFSRFHFITNEPGELLEFMGQERRRIPTYCAANLVMFGAHIFGAGWIDLLRRKSRE